VFESYEVELIEQIDNKWRLLNKLPAARIVFQAEVAGTKASSGLDSARGQYCDRCDLLQTAVCNGIVYSGKIGFYANIHSSLPRAFEGCEVVKVIKEG
jgi:hypothetical protein